MMKVPTGTAMFGESVSVAAKIGDKEAISHVKTEALGGVTNPDAARKFAADLLRCADIAESLLESIKESSCSFVELYDWDVGDDALVDMTR